MADGPEEGDRPDRGDRPECGDQPEEGDRPERGDQPASGDPPQPGRHGRSGAPPAEAVVRRRAPAAPEPLGEGERPTALLMAIAVCIVLALGVIVGAATIHDLGRHGGSLPGAAFLSAILALLAQGMYRRRYWALLGFQALLIFQILVTSLALVVASTIAAAALCLLTIGLGGWLFWKLVGVLGRVQAGER